MDVTSEEYLSIWPQMHEPWCAELEVFHNPYARYALPNALLPEATHWTFQSGEWESRAFYPKNILWSGTLVTEQTDPIPTYETIPAYLEMLARRDPVQSD